MLLYWGMFTIGFTIGAVFSFITFAAKKPEEEKEYLPESKPLTNYLLKDSPSVDKAPTASLFTTNQLPPSSLQNAKIT